MLTVSEVIARADYTVSTVACSGRHRDWSGVEVGDDHHVVLVRRGRFRRRSGGIVADLDRAMGYLGVPGEEERFAHPAGGDLCTSIAVSSRLWRDLTGAGSSRSAGCTFQVDPALDLAHRRVLAASADADFALAEELLGLLGRVLRTGMAQPTPGSTPARDRALVAVAREMLAAAHPASMSLSALAAHLDVSAYRLSRAFSRETGVSLTRYRNRVRVMRAVDRLEEGGDELATVAAELGFADQAHLTRTVREHLGRTPAAVRRLLSEVEVDSYTGRRRNPPG